MLRSIRAVLAGYIVFGGSAGLLFAVSGQDPQEVPSLAFAVGSVMYGVVFAFLGGWIAAHLGRPRELLHAGAMASVMVILAGVSMILRYSEGSLWSEFATMMLMAPAAVAGGLVRKGTRQESSDGSGPA